MKDLLSKEHYSYKIHTLLMKSSAYPPLTPLYGLPPPSPISTGKFWSPFYHFSKIPNHPGGTLHYISINFHILHQMKPYSSIKAICWSSYACFIIFGELGQVKQISPQIPQIMGTNAEKVIYSVKLHISCQIKPYISVKAIWGLSHTCVSVFGHWGKSRKFGPNNSNHGHRYIESHPKC